MLKPAKLKLTIYQGATFDLRMTWAAAGVPVDLTGRTARMQVRASVDSPDVLLSLTTANGGIVLGGTAGTIDLLVSANDTAALSFTSGVFDLEMVSGGYVERLAYGQVIVVPEVTRG